MRTALTMLEGNYMDRRSTTIISSCLVLCIFLSLMQDSSSDVQRSTTGVKHDLIGYDVQWGSWIDTLSYFVTTTLSGVIPSYVCWIDDMHLFVLAGCIACGQ
jgi:hypothetical protein